MFRLVVSGRALVPGSIATIAVGHDLPRPGDDLVVAFGADGRPEGTVGTRAEVRDAWADGLRPLAEVVGVELGVVALRAPGWCTFTPLPVTAAPSSAVAGAERDLRRWMAARLEAGLGGDITLTLSREPEIASHQVASWLQVTGPELQDVLEAGDAGARLDRAAAVLRRETLLLRATWRG